MLRKVIEYEDLDGVKQSKEFYFNLSRAELIEMAVDDEDNGMIKRLESLVEAAKNKELIGEFKNMILLTYGERDGEHFRKSEEISKNFTEHPAYDALFWEMSTSDGAFINFLNALLPQGIMEEAERLVAQNGLNKEAAEIQSKILNGDPMVQGQTPPPPPEFTLPPPAPTA